jgi:hypothetical protein
VLFTAEHYISHIRNSCDRSQWDFAKHQLARLTRCPHLSRYWLSASIAAEQAYMRLLADLRPQLRRLLLRDAQADYPVQSADLREGQQLAGAPPSWALGRRAIKSVGSVDLVWQLDVSQLRDAARRSFVSQCTQYVVCSEVSPPLGGIAFRMQLVCRSKHGGVEVTLYCGPSLPEDMCYICRFTVEMEGLETATLAMRTAQCGAMWGGWENVFGGGPMAEGWDEVAWAGRGLPTGGKLTIKLAVSELFHAPNLQQ